jgi:uncharacterized alkaline shock family protein YloU
MLRTSNLYGRITVLDRAICNVAGATVLECYGVWGLSNKNSESWHKNCVKRQHFGRAVRVTTVNNYLRIDLNIVLKFGVSIEAVVESIRSAVKYNVENFCGMTVEYININILGIQ